MKRNAELGQDEAVLSRVRVIPLGRTEAVKMTPELAMRILTIDPRLFASTSAVDVVKIHEAFDAMMEERSFEDYEGRLWEPISQPNFIISGLMMGHVVPALKEKYALPFYMWFVGCAAALTRTLGPTEKGGGGGTYEAECQAIEADSEKNGGRPFWQICRDVWAKSSSFPDDIVHVKGLPPLYQWENAPQSSWFPWTYDSAVAGGRLLQVTDGLLLPSVTGIEREGIEGVKDWYAGTTNRPVLSLGPQLPPVYYAPFSSEDRFRMARTEVQYSGRPPNQSAASDANDLDASLLFLDGALHKYGMCSTLYISFGSTYFPNKRHFEILLGRILALQRPMPFIFAAASPRTSVSDELVAKIQTSGRGLIVPWAPQQAILSHRALAAVVSHCGGGGTFESLSQGVPVIAWPCLLDQPSNAVWMSEVLDTGFELLQVRDGPIKGKAMRGGPEGTEITGTDEAIAKEMDEVLVACQGEEGNRKRANAEKVKLRIWNAHRPEGQIDQHLDSLREFASARI